MVPHAAPLQPDPATLQFTEVLLLFETVAVNCCWAPVSNWTLVGEIFTAGASTTVTVAVADLLESAAEVAVTETSAGLGTDDGAV